MNRPTLSVIIPFYSEFSYLERSLGSVLAAGDVVTEVLLVNDAATPEVKRLLQPFEQVGKLRVLHNPDNIGAGGSRNHGLSKATSDYVLFLDADDLLSPLGLREAMAFAAQTGADLVHLPSLVYEPASGVYWKYYRDAALFGQRVRRTDVRKMPALRYAAANWSFLCSRTLMERAEIRFDPEQRVAEDHLFLIQLLEAANHVALFDRWCHLWRRRGGSLSQAQARIADQWVKLASLRKALTFMQQHYAMTDRVFQLDYAFGLLRFVYTWDFFDTLLPKRRVSPEASALLEGLAELAEAYPLLPEIAADPLLHKTTPDGLSSYQGTPLNWDVLPDLHAALAARDWDTLEKILFVQDSLPAVIGIKADAGHETPLICLPLRHLASPCANVLDRSGIAALSEDAAKALVDACVSRDLTLILGDPMDAIMDAYEQAIGSDTQDMRMFSEFLLDEIDAIMRFPGLIAAAAQAKGVSLCVRWLSRNADLSKVPGLDRSVALRPVAGDLACAAEKEAKVEMPTDLRTALAEMRTQVRGWPTGNAGGDTPEHARRATRAMVLNAWQADLGNRLVTDGADAGTAAMSKGVLGILWQLAEQDAAIPKGATPRSEIRTMDQLRFGDACPDGRRTVKRVLKHRLRNGWIKVGLGGAHGKA